MTVNPVLLQGAPLDNPSKIVFFNSKLYNAAQYFIVESCVEVQQHGAANLKFKKIEKEFYTPGFRGGKRHREPQRACFTDAGTSRDRRSYDPAATQKKIPRVQRGRSGPTPPHPIPVTKISTSKLMSLSL